jgi:hypothetical protein
MYILCGLILAFGAFMYYQPSVFWIFPVWGNGKIIMTTIKSIGALIMLCAVALIIYYAYYISVSSH